MKAPDICRSFAGKLVVSCQADPQDVFFGLADRFAAAAVAGGAAGIRANGPDDVRAIRAAVAVPIIGIHKIVHSDGKVLITPTVEAAKSLVDAGASMIALDCTRRGRETGALGRLRRIKSELRVPVLADIATVEEAVMAVEAGADVVLSTMRGYTDETSGVRAFEPDFIGELTAAVTVPVIAEGRIDTPAAAAEAILRGAFAVVVGSAITRPHVIARLFADAVERASEHHGQEIGIIGIDLGGTNTKFGVVSRAGKLLWSDVTPTPAAGGRAALLEVLKRAARAALDRCREAGRRPAAIGIATAGWVDTATGRVAYATDNLPGWTGTPIADEIHAATGVRVFVENDANALAAAEKEFGAGRDFGDFVCITLGTGVGGGCYTGGRLNRGAHFFANAVGHISIEPGGRLCNCGQRGCLERYANAAAMVEYAGGTYDSAEKVIAAANAGDVAAVAAIRELAHYLAIGCAMIVQLLDPEAIILAGGLAQNNPILIAALKAELSGRVSVWQQRRLQIRSSELGYHAGVLGAAAIAVQNAMFSPVASGGQANLSLASPDR